MGLWERVNNSFCATCSTAKVLPPLMLERMKRSPRACACAALVIIIIIAIAVHYNIWLYTTLKIINTQTNTYQCACSINKHEQFYFLLFKHIQSRLFCRWSKLVRLFWKLHGCYTRINTALCTRTDKLRSH